jgi:hypothetical protein
LIDQGDSPLPQAGERAIALINQFPNLERLIAFAPLSADCLARIERLKSLREIRLQGKQPDLLGSLKLLSGSQKLESFAASGWIIPGDNLSLLSTCPHLQRVLVGRLAGSHEQLAFLAKLPDLKILELPDLQYRADLANDLKLLGGLKELRVDRTTWSREQLRQLGQECPNLKLTLYRGLVDEMNDLRQP